MNWMNMFDQTHSLVPGHFIGYYSELFSFKDNFEEQKQCGTLKVTCFDSDFDKLENGIKPL